MENMHASDKTKRDFSAEDYHYPCNKLEPKYKSDCYMMQTTRMSEMGLGTAQIFEECKKADSYRFQCMQSEGRDLSNGARINDPKFTSQMCEMVAGNDRIACMFGVVYALLDNTWDGKYAFPFCESFLTEEDKKHCFSAGVSYMKTTFAKTPQDIKTDCEKYVKNSGTCAENAKY